MAVMNDEFIDLILSIVAEIPEGKVATYGLIAKLAGYDKNARLVGKVLSNASLYGDYPCHRIVNGSGRLVVGWDAQAQLLEAEEVYLKENGNVDLKKYLWTI
ncbi:MAG: MGMT family protein [Erysipelotrichales bacterium]